MRCDLDTSDLDLAPTNLGKIRQLTSRLNENRTALYLFFQLSPDLFCIADSSGYFQKVNKAWTTTLGWSEEELLAVPFVKFMHPDDISATNDAMVGMRQNEIIRFHNRYKRKPGTICTIDNTVAGDDDYVMLEWSSTAWDNGLTYASARQVPHSCAKCPDIKKFSWMFQHENANAQRNTK